MTPMLRRGNVLLIDGLKFKVEHVNTCRAYAVACVRRTYIVHDKKGHTRQVTRTTYVEANISPNTDPAVLREIAKGLL